MCKKVQECHLWDKGGVNQVPEVLLFSLLYIAQQHVSHSAPAYCRAAENDAAECFALPFYLQTG
jgi:hypothetical protein